MIFPRHLQRFIAVWRAQDAVSRFVIGASLLLVVFAYLPTLQFDYVTQDQWRAFRYSTDPQSSIDRAQSCVKMIPRFYIQSGRPLVWITECLEHAVVSSISDFFFLRPIMLAVVIASVLYLGLVLSPFISGTATGVIAASALVMVPGYSFMFLQGMTAMMVLISIIFAAASFRLFSQRNINGCSKLKTLFLSSAFFILACLIYPAYAFIVIPLTLIEFGFNVSERISKRIYTLFNSLAFYFLSSVFYYAFIKIGVLIIEKIRGKFPNLGNYEVTIQLTPKLIIERLQEIATYFYSMSPFNFPTWHGLPIAILATFSIGLGWLSYKHNGRSVKSLPLFSVLIFVIAGFTLIASVSPWLFSKMDGFSTRHHLPWNLFYCAATAGLLSLFLKHILKVNSKGIPIAVLLGFLLPVALVQHRLSILEAVVTGVEIQAMRAKIHDWVEQKGWINNRHLLVVLPSTTRPIGIETATKYDQNFVLASSQNPVSVPWMVNSLLREQIPNQNFKLVDCAFNQSCVSGLLQDPENVVIGYTYGFEPINSPVQPYLINLSQVTTKPVNPSINLIIELPKIVASSTLDNYGPFGLLSSVQPGWHAEKNPAYPQKIAIDFKEMRLISQVGLLPQDRHTIRMPKAITINTSVDGKSWVNVATFDNVCVANVPGNWHNFELPNQVETQFLEIEILANCGDPDFLTLRGLKVE
ncbi:MAG: discoidin domain-containing protein [Candidatus Thiosymbion ectosymbiont of Robbea hypermnestra]|nr:discoidin domain-containing protein [Candidatus Thiosymbion ectosymbiont of Robbea hypermnestra]